MNIPCSNFPDHQRILVAPLNWGLGHASRCIPVIRTLRQLGHEIIIAADASPLALLQEEFKDLKRIEFIRFPGLNVSYDKGHVTRSILRHLPAYLLQVRREHRRLQELIDSHRISIVISDNRFGLWTRKIPCFYITHQLMIKAPQSLKWSEWLLYRIHRLVIRRYSECWIPDVKDNGGLSGDLSHRHPLPPNARFIGVLSRFSILTPQDLKESDCFHTVALISGPEPQRSEFESMVLRELLKRGTKSLILRGLPDRTETKVVQNVTLVPHLPSRLLMAHLIRARRIICRSGYSTMMDLAVLHKRAEITPTRGQTEQEYLCNHLVRRNIHDRWLGEL